MTTTELEHWRLAPRLLWELQTPGCHTSASGFDYVSGVEHENGADCPAYRCRGRIKLKRNDHGVAICAQCRDCKRTFSMQMLALLGYDWRSL